MGFNFTRIAHRCVPVVTDLFGRNGLLLFELPRHWGRELDLGHVLQLVPQPFGRSPRGLPCAILLGLRLTVVLALPSDSFLEELHAIRAIDRTLVAGLRPLCASQMVRQFMAVAGRHEAVVLRAIWLPVAAWESIVGPGAGGDDRGGGRGLPLGSTHDCLQLVLDAVELSVHLEQPALLLPLIAHYIRFWAAGKLQSLTQTQQHVPIQRQGPPPLRHRPPAPP